jgi:hypothetical protein
MKMGRRLRCSSVTYGFRYAPSTASPARTALPAAHFDRNKTHAISGTGRWSLDLMHPLAVGAANLMRRSFGSYLDGFYPFPCEPVLLMSRIAYR